MNVGRRVISVWVLLVGWDGIWCCRWVVAREVHKGSLRLEAQMTKYSKKKQKKNKKMQNTLFLGPFCQNLGKNDYFTKIGFRHFLVSIVP